MDQLKINFDGSFFVDSLFGGVGVIVRDSRGSMVQARPYGFPCSSPLMAKCYAPLATLTTALDLGLNPVMLEGDSLEVISLLSNTSDGIPWNISCIMHDCKTIIQSLNDFKCCHVRCCANVVAD